MHVVLRAYIRFISVDKVTLESQGRAVEASIDNATITTASATTSAVTSRVLVSCGDPLFGSEVLVKIVNPDTSVALEEDNVSAFIL
jgi:hypothetical protein